MHVLEPVSAVTPRACVTHCVAQIWDLTAGKSLVDLCQANKHEVTGLEYHPFEFLLATSSRDKVRAPGGFPAGNQA